MTREEYAKICAEVAKEKSALVENCVEELTEILDDIIYNTEKEKCRLEEGDTYLLPTFCGNAHYSLHKMMYILCQLYEGRQEGEMYKKLSEVMKNESAHN